MSFSYWKTRSMMHHILSIKVTLHCWTLKTLKSKLNLGFQFYLSVLLALLQLVITLLVSSTCLGYLLRIFLLVGFSVVSDSCNPMDCILPGSPVHGIFQARIMEWVVLSFSRDPSWPRDRTYVFHVGRLILYNWVPWEAFGRLCVSVAQLRPTLATLWTVARRLLCPWNSPGKDPGVGCHFLFQGIFQTKRLNLDLLHCKCILYHLSQQGTLDQE